MTNSGTLGRVFAPSSLSRPFGSVPVSVLASIGSRFPALGPGVSCLGSRLFCDLVLFFRSTNDGDLVKHEHGCLLAGVLRASPNCNNEWSHV
jgi:hypothetical protein